MVNALIWMPDRGFLVMNYMLSSQMVDRAKGNNALIITLIQTHSFQI